MQRRNPAPTRRHRDLERKLWAFAKANGFPGRQKNPLRPDVVTWDEDEVFIGDAKVAANEPPTRSATRTRVERYLSRMGALLRSGKAVGGMLAIITDDASKARAWRPVLEDMATRKRLRGPRGGRPRFEVEPFRGAWVVSWRVGR